MLGIILGIILGIMLGIILGIIRGIISGNKRERALHKYAMLQLKLKSIIN